VIQDDGPLRLAETGACTSYDDRCMPFFDVNGNKINKYIYTDPWPLSSKGRNCFSSFFGTVICTISPCYKIEQKGMSNLINKCGVM
jgi:hypothetical protein